jgi:hypothetical protein
MERKGAPFFFMDFLQRGKKIFESLKIHLIRSKSRWTKLFMERLMLQKFLNPGRDLRRAFSFHDLSLFLWRLLFYRDFQKIDLSCAAKGASLKNLLNQDLKLL